MSAKIVRLVCLGSSSFRSFRVWETVVGEPARQGETVIRFMSRGEIADYLGVTLATVKQYKTFPPPDAMIGRNQGWTKETVDEWVKSRKT